jgi:hypothetical protein
MAKIKIELSELVASNNFRKVARLPDREERLQLSSRGFKFRARFD